MVVVDMLDRILDSLSEALMHKMPSSSVRRARCLSLATWLPSTSSRSPPQTPRPLDLQTDRRGGAKRPSTSTRMSVFRFKIALARSLG